MPSRAIAVPVAAVLGAAVLFTGCARSRITTEVRPDGSWTRTTVFTGAVQKEGSMAPPLEDSFVLPSGAAWKSHEEKKDDNRILTFERTLAAGAVLKGDLSLKGDGGKLTLVNEATVTRSGNRLEYRETLKWTGPPPDSATVKPESLAHLKASLPKALATDANVRALAAKGQQLLLPLLFGPGDPLLSLVLVHPDLGEMRMRQKIGGLLVKALEEQFGGQLSPDQRREVAKRIISDGFTSSKPAAPDPSSGDKSGKGSGGLTPLMFIVKMPGRVVSSNGEVDELSGEVFWALFPEAASLKELVLTATSEVGQK